MILQKNWTKLDRPSDQYDCIIDTYVSNNPIYRSCYDHILGGCQICARDYAQTRAAILYLYVTEGRAPSSMLNAMGPMSESWALDPQ